MKVTTLIFILFLTTLNSFAGNKIQWQKFLNDTTINSGGRNWKVQAYTTDSNQNIYLSSICNCQDTNLSIITKHSPNGQLLWKTSVLPFSENNRFSTRQDWESKMYIDLEDNLVFITAGYDSAGWSQNSYNKRFVLLTKMSKDGELINSKIDYIPNYHYSTGRLGDIDIQPNGDILVSHDVIDSPTNFYFFVNKYNKNFDSLFSLTSNPNLPGEYIEERTLAIASKDSLLNIAYETSTPNVMHHWHLIQVNTNNGDTVWQQSTHNFNISTYQLQLEIMNNALYLVSNQIIKLSLLDGSILKSNASNYQAVNCIFDSNENKIYAKNRGTYEIKIFDGTELQEIKTFLPNFPPTDIVKLGSTITVIGLEQSPSNIQVEVYRMNTNLELLNTFHYEYIKPIYGVWSSGYFKPRIMVDNLNNVIVMSEVYTDPNLIPFSSPVFLQKICFNCANDIEGKVYIDVNQNCQYDSTDLNVTNNLVHLMPEDIYTNTDSNGFYSFVKSQGIGTVEYIPAFQNAINCNGITSYTVNTANGYADSLDFGLRFKAGIFKDIATKIISGVARPGFIQYASIDVTNVSNQKLFNSKVSLEIDSNFSFISSSLSPDSVVGNQVYWTMDTMDVLEVKNIMIQLQVATNTLGANFTHSVNAYCINDIDTANNIDTTSGIIIGSFDPNYIAVEPIGISTQHYIENGTTLDYYIEFQNTGTDTAFNINIIDKLDTRFDLTSLKITGSSHEMKYTIDNNSLKFNFPNILLVDSNKDYKKSIGYVTYSIKPKQCMDGTVIKNTAEIYFDFNDPIITNTVFHTIGKPGSYFNPDDVDNMNIFPNPGKSSSLNIVVNLVGQYPYQLMITDYLGRKISYSDTWKLSNGKYYHNIKFGQALSEGLYFITLKTPNSKVVKKWSFVDSYN